LEEPFANLVSTQIRETVIEQDQIGHHHLSAPDAFAPGESCDDLKSGIRRGQRVFHENEQHLGIVDNDDFFACFRKWRLRCFRRCRRRRRRCRLRRQRLRLAQSLEEDMVPGAMNGSRSVDYSFGFVRAQFFPAHHLAQRAGATEISRDRMSHLTVKKMDFARLFVRRSEMQDGAGQIHALQRDEIL
jgi:hypothetical protein